MTDLEIIKRGTIEILQIEELEKKLNKKTKQEKQFFLV